MKKKFIIHDRSNYTEFNKSLKFKTLIKIPYNDLNERNKNVSIFMIDYYLCYLKRKSKIISSIIKRGTQLQIYLDIIIF
jgi:hypothetical protein